MSIWKFLAKSRQENGRRRNVGSIFNKNPYQFQLVVINSNCKSSTISSFSTSHRILLRVLTPCPTVPYAVIHSLNHSIPASVGCTPPGPAPGRGNAAGSKNKDSPPQAHGLAGETTCNLSNWRNVAECCGSPWRALHQSRSRRRPLRKRSLS